MRKEGVTFDTARDSIGRFVLTHGRSPSQAAQRHHIDSNFYFPALQSVEKTAASNVESHLRSVDASDASLTRGEMRSVGTITTSIRVEFRQQTRQIALLVSTRHTLVRKYLYLFPTASVRLLAIGANGGSGCTDLHLYNTQYGFARLTSTDSTNDGKQWALADSAHL